MDPQAKVTKAPKAQPSRKGKRAWRKNIDVDEINETLDAKRDREILHGEDDNDEFVIDTKASVGKKLEAKKLKMTEILTNKSKIAPIRSRLTKKKVSGTRVKELMALAGHLLTEKKSEKRLEKDGLVKGDNVDVWGNEEEPPLPDIYKKTAYLSVTKPTKRPKTLAESSINLTLPEHKGTVEKDVVAGKSYNPSLELWQELINKEFESESTVEMQRQAMAEHEKRIQFLIENMKDDEFELDDDDEETVKTDEEAESVPDEEKYKLSINAPAKWKKKTKTERNRLARHKQRTELEAKLKEIRQRMKELSRLEDIEKEVQEKKEKTQQKHTKEKKHKRLGKNEVIFKPLEVKLSDELTGNLKNLKPEGNLFYEQMHKLQATGKVTATGLRKKRRYAPKIVEKHSYRHFK